MAFAINLSRWIARLEETSLRELRGILLERGLAAARAEGVCLAAIHRAARRAIRVHHPAANRIFFHLSPPASASARGHSRGRNRRSVIEFITTETELNPMAAPAMIGFSTMLTPGISPTARIPAARGISAVL